MKTNETTKTTTDATTEVKTLHQTMWEARNARRDSRRDEFVEADAIMELALKAQRIKSEKGLPIQSKVGCRVIEEAREVAGKIDEMIDYLEMLRATMLDAGMMYDTTRVPSYVRDMNDIVTGVAKVHALAKALDKIEGIENTKAAH